MIFRALLSLAALSLLFYFLVAARRRPAQKIAFTATFALIATFAAIPELSTQVALLVGIGRGVDLLLYLSSIVLLFLSFNLYLGQREGSEQLTLLARRLALQSARAPIKESTQLPPLPGAWAQEEVFLLIPAYQEGTRLREVIEEVSQHFQGIIVIDDGSRDETSSSLKNAPVHLIQHPINLGQGAALQTGFDYALSIGAEVLITFDADGQHRVEDALEMLSALRGETEHTRENEATDADRGPAFDLILGSRFLGSAENMPTSRRVLLKAAVLFTRVAGGVKVTDTHNGLRALHHRAFSRLKISQNRMAHASELLHQLNEESLRYREIPVIIRYSEESLAKGQSGLGAINILFDLLLKRIFG